MKRNEESQEVHSSRLSSEEAAPVPLTSSEAPSEAASEIGYMLPRSGDCPKGLGKEMLDPIAFLKVMTLRN